MRCFQIYVHKYEEEHECIGLLTGKPQVLSMMTPCQMVAKVLEKLAATIFRTVQERMKAASFFEKSVST